MQEPSLQEARPAADRPMADQPAVNYKETLNLPQTAFKMKAGAATREVEIERWWDENRIYQHLTETRDKNRRFLLHDGPPYLSADKIHIGTALNKILKDIVTRYKSQRGFYTPYVPGYDGHGLPIENAVVKTIKGGRHAITPAELRKRCRAFALSNLKGQESDFRRLGVWANWEKPYITVDAAFEAAQVAAFGEMYRKGYIYKGLKPVYWCPQCETALADAEVEYDDHVSHSIYVKFPIKTLDKANLDSAQQTLLQNASLIIWTTTPWTLPANLALAVNPEFDYVVWNSGPSGKFVLARDLLPRLQELITIPEDGKAENKPVVEGVIPGRALEGILTRHPFIDRGSPVLLGDHVTLDAGAGVVHTAPGHGMEDYLVVQKYNREALKDSPIPILSPVDSSGKFTAEANVPAIEGIFYEKANETILNILKDKNALLRASKYSHSYPHCWRCRQPVIYRATDQWFIDIDQFRAEALAAVDTVTWLPERGRNRIFGMVEGRGDWCLSRQRVWGVPIPVFYCVRPDCREVFVTPKAIAAIRAKFEAHSSDIWWEQSADELLAELPEGDRSCPKCGGRAFDKEMDIMDVWFDSGITHTAVVQARREELGDLPADLYLEGSDQHRGWFQSSLLTSVMLYGKAPYRSVLTHGFVLDEQGRKMSKSLGNVVDPHTIIREYGADVLRLWVASVDYTNDVRIGKNTLHQMAEVYKKVRNTVRFILGNLHDFDPGRDRVPAEGLSRLDRYTLRRARHIMRNITDAFEQWEFYRYCHEIQYLCMADLSQLYFDVTKDILYCDAVNAPRRRAVQTVLHELLSLLLPVLVPVMPHLAEDIRLSLPEHQRPRVTSEDVAAAVLLPWPELPANDLASDDFESLLAVRDAVNRALEGPRSEGRIGSSLEATVTLLPKTEPIRDALTQAGPDELAVLLITSGVSIVTEAPKPPASSPWLAQLDADGVTVFVAASPYAKCQRCWRYEPTVGQMADHPSICERCGQAVHCLPLADQSLS
jgi:isoleucyl-tRNA synthetase